MMTELVRRILGSLPFTCGPGGMKWNTLGRCLDPVLRSSVPGLLSTRFGDLRIDQSHDGQRVLSYSFHNVLGHYEKSDLARLIRWSAGEGKTFVDIGANLGMYSLLARECGFETHLVEPEPRHSSFLMQNRNQFGVVHALGMSNKLGELPMFYEAGNSGATSFLETPDSQMSEQTVPVRAFSDVAIEGGFGDVDKISLIKIDVEGHEPETVQGFDRFLEQGHRPMIWAEVRGARSGRRPRSYQSVMTTLSKFQYVAIDPSRWATVTLDTDDLSQRQVFDLFFVRDDSVAKRVIKAMGSGQIQAAA